MSFSVKQRALLRDGRTPEIWTVAFSESGKIGYREDAAKGLVARVSTNGEPVRNDFDRISIFQRPIFNATWDKLERRWIHLTPQSDPDFTWSPSEPYREVVYRCRPFWYKLDMSSAYAPTRISVSEKYVPGFTLAPMFRNENDFVFRPCFEMGIGADGLPHSRAGLTPYRDQMPRLMAQATAYSGMARIESAKDWFSDCLLLLVEFATWYLSDVMSGNTTDQILQTGAALPQIKASSGSTAGGACVWRGKENPWKNSNSALYDLFLKKETDAQGNCLGLWYLPDYRDFDGSLNARYQRIDRFVMRTSGLLDISGYAFGKDFFYPCATGAAGISQKGALYIVSDYTKTTPVAVSAGGNSSTTMAATYVKGSPFTWECADLSNWRAAYFGGRLILEEEGRYATL